MADAASHPRSLSSAAPDQTATYAGTFYQQGTGRGWAAVPKERRGSQGLLPAGGPQAAEEEASLSWPRGLVPEDEEGSLPLPSSG